MSRWRLNICAPDIFERDAVGNFCLGLARACEAMGIAAALYARNFRTGSRVSDIGRLAPEGLPNELLLVSYSILDADLRQHLSWRGRKVCYYHGVTPPGSFDGYDRRTASLCERARRQLPELSKFDVLFTNSRATALDLQAALPADRDIVPIPPVSGRFLRPLLDVGLRTPPDDYGARLLYVGRVTPHKRVHELIELLAAYRTYDPNAILEIVGGADNTSYNALLKAAIDSFGLPPHSIRLSGLVSDSQLCERYASADVYVTMSAHEGFCVPVLEAMLAGLPVFAFELPAVKEVLAGAGVLVNGRDAVANAAVLRKLLSNRFLWRYLSRMGKERAQVLLRGGGSDELVEILDLHMSDTQSRHW